MIDPGGDNVRTVFWEPKSNSCDMVKEKLYFNHYDQLEEIESHVIKQHEWALLYGMNQIHSVENIQTDRISLQIGLMRDPLSDLLILKDKGNDI